MKNIKLNLVNGKPVCDPPVTEVQPGEIVTWDGSTVEQVFLESKNTKVPPFTTGGFGPLSTKDKHIVNSKPPLKKNDKFTFTTGGDIIIG